MLEGTASGRSLRSLSGRLPLGEMLWKVVALCLACSTVVVKGVR